MDLQDIILFNIIYIGPHDTLFSPKSGLAVIIMVSYSTNCRGAISQCIKKIGGIAFPEVGFHTTNLSTNLLSCLL